MEVQGFELILQLLSNAISQDTQHHGNLMIPDFNGLILFIGIGGPEYLEQAFFG